MSMPQLFDRLRAGARPPALRECVARDIASLLNCALRGASLGLPGDAPVARSVLNLGNPCLLPMGASRVDPQQIAAGIRHCLAQFEPRLLAERTSVQARLDTDRAGEGKLYFDLRAVLLPHEDVVIRLQLDYLDGLFTWVRDPA